MEYSFSYTFPVMKMFMQNPLYPRMWPEQLRIEGIFPLTFYDSLIKLYVNMFVRQIFKIYLILSGAR